MREKRKPEFTVSLKIRGKTTAKILFFSSEQWEGAPRNCYRLMKDGVWMGGVGVDKSFYNHLDCQRLLMGQAVGECDATPPANIKHGTRISVFSGRYFDDGTPEYHGTFAFGDPFRGYDGRWYVPTSLPERGGVMACVDDIIVCPRRK